MCGASQLGHTDVVIELLQRRADVNQVTSDASYSALHCAALMDRRDAVRALLEYGADHTMRSDADGCSALDYAVQQGHSELQRCLEGWAAMSPGSQLCVTQFGWGYYELPKWRRRIHHQFPGHLRAQVVAAALVVGVLLPGGRGRGDVAELLCRGIDSRKRGDAFVF